MNREREDTVILVNMCPNMLNLPQAIAFWVNNSLSIPKALREHEQLSCHHAKDLEQELHCVSH